MEFLVSSFLRHNEKNSKDLKFQPSSFKDKKIHHIKLPCKLWVMRVEIPSSRATALRRKIIIYAIYNIEPISKSLKTLHI